MAFFILLILFFYWLIFNISNLDFNFWKWAIAGIFINQLILFIQNKTKYANTPRNMGTMFIIPYLRIVPMHLTILLPKFIGWTPALTFLILKTVFDVVGHLITTPYYWSKKESLPEEGYT